MGQRFWFKAKTYGWGWTPCTWQGWSILAAFIGVTAYSFYTIEAQTQSPEDALIAFAPIAAFNIVVLLVICYLTGEKPRWQWGKRN